jgi:hypothetical protein
MKFVELASFDVVHEHLAWPWLAFAPTGERVAFAESKQRIATRFYDGGGVTEGPGFPLPPDLALRDIRGFSIDAAGALLAITAVVDTRSVVITSDAGGEQRRSRIETLAAGGFAARAVTFDRGGTRLWISAESDTETALLLVDARSHALVGIARSPAFPRPSTHELYVHPQDDAVLLLAACGEEGTFARVVGWSGEGVEAIETALDSGGVPAGFVGFSADVSRVHLAEADELRTHSWPALVELSSVDLADDFVSSFAGAVLGGHIYVDGELADVGEDAVMRFDSSAIRGKLLPPPVPAGMWAGRLGTNAIVTVEAKGDPARGRVIRIALPDSSN